jgi:putative thioredoxin
MSSSAPHVIDVSDESFATEVLARSQQVPVVVDFWAPWCGPCRALAPVLEKLAEEFAGAFVLAKLNTDEQPATAGRYGIRGIPHVMVFVAGEVVDQFTGALPEARLRTFLRRHCPSELDQLCRDAQACRDRGDLAGAAGRYERALARDPDHAGALLGLARVAVARGELEAAAAHAARISPRADERAEAEQLLQAVELARSAAAVGSRAACAERLADDPGDLEARYALAGHEVAAGDHRAALELYLDLVKRDRRWRDEAARKAMLIVFHLAGVRSPLSDEFRRQLMLAT